MLGLRWRGRRRSSAVFRWWIPGWQRDARLSRCCETLIVGLGDDAASGFAERIDSIAAGAERRLTVHPRGESGVRVAFDAGSQHIDAGEQGYFEAVGGYRVSVTVQPDLTVSVASDLRSY